nr:ATP synthase F1 subunit delta [uncultured Sphaerochaeta sp.]
MKGLLVIKRYARALYETSREESRLKELEEDIAVLNRLFSELPELRQFCLNPSDSHGKNRIFVETAFLPYLSYYTGRTIGELLRNNRLEALPYLAEALQEEMDRSAHITAVIIESAAEQDDETKEEIGKQLEKRIGGGIRPVWRVRRELLGGLTFQWNNLFLDMSLRGRLNGFKAILKRKTI